MYFGANRIRCRICLGLRYHSQQLQPVERTVHRAHRIVRQLAPDDEDGLPIDFPPKPKGMRWATYRYLEDRHERLMGKLYAASRSRLGIVQFACFMASVSGRRRRRG